jgi:hypothetical protein
MSPDAAGRIITVNCAVLRAAVPRRGRIKPRSGRCGGTLQADDAREDRGERQPALAVSPSATGHVRRTSGRGLPTTM